MVVNYQSNPLSDQLISMHSAAYGIYQLFVESNSSHLLFSVVSVGLPHLTGATTPSSHHAGTSPSDMFKLVHLELTTKSSWPSTLKPL